MALDAVIRLSDTMTSPMDKIKCLRLELQRAKKDRAIAIQLNIARIQEEELKDDEAALETLKKLVAETGANGPGFEPLHKLLDLKEEWQELSDLLDQRISTIDDKEMQLVAINKAILLHQESLVEDDAAKRESLYKKLLEHHPEDRQTLERLGKIYRDADRWDDLIQLLNHRIELTTDTEQIRLLTHEMANIYAILLDNNEKPRSFTRLC